MTVRSYLLGGTALRFYFDDEIDVRRVDPITGEALPPAPYRCPKPLFAPDAKLEPVSRFPGGGMQGSK